jgi:hypothetical protein
MVAVTFTTVRVGTLLGRRQDRHPRRAPPLAVGLAVVLLVLVEAAAVTATVCLVDSGMGWQSALLTYLPSNAWLGATFAPFGALVAARRPRLAIGWLVLGFALLYGFAAAGLALFMTVGTGPHPGLLTRLVGWIGLTLWTPAVVLAAYLGMVSLSRLVIGGRAGTAGAVVAALLIAGAFAPARERLQRWPATSVPSPRRSPPAHAVTS